LSLTRVVRAKAGGILSGDARGLRVRLPLYDHFDVGQRDIMAVIGTPSLTTVPCAERGSVKSVGLSPLRSVESPRKYYLAILVGWWRMSGEGPLLRSSGTDPPLGSVMVCTAHCCGAWEIRRLAWSCRSGVRVCKSAAPLGEVRP
jgi:hypothetical protein